MNILLPIYQNCTNGHWDQHPTYPMAGKVFKLTVAAYGVWFLIFQIIQGDAFEFVTFLAGSRQSTFFELMGWKKNPIIVMFDLNKQKKWVTLIMTVMYGLLHFSGFPLFWVYLHQKEVRQNINRGYTKTNKAVTDHGMPVANDGELIL